MMFAPWVNQKCCFIWCKSKLIKNLFGFPCVYSFKRIIILSGANFALNVTVQMSLRSCSLRAADKRNKILPETSFKSKLRAHRIKFQNKYMTLLWLHIQYEWHFILINYFIAFYIWDRTIYWFGTLIMTLLRHKLVEWRAGSAGPRLVGSICSGSCGGQTERQTGSTTGCNTRHERGGEAGPMSCVAAPGPAKRSPSAQAGNSWSTVKRETGRHRGRKCGREGEKERYSQLQ